MSGERAPDRVLQRATIVAVGSELLTPWRLDTNSLFVTKRLNELGIEVGLKFVVGDEPADLAAACRLALSRSDLVVFTGGLGPTDDDLTREVVAQVLELPLREDPAIVERIRARFAARGWQMPENNRRQARVPRGAVVLDNSNGTAPGLWIDRDGQVVLLLPGPPRELEPMLDRLMGGPLAARTGGTRLYRRVIKVAGRTESHVEEAVEPVYAGWRARPQPIQTTILAAPGQIELHLLVRAGDPESAERVLDEAAAEIVAALGRDVFSTDGRSLEHVVGDLLRARRAKVAIAESCTGGLVASRLTDVPGSSDYVERGIVAYSNAAKIELLGVDRDLIAKHGAVSEPVAAAMARGARARARVDYGVGVTGIAGPGGGSERKPVGTVAIAVEGPGDRRRVRTVRLPGGREQVKFWSAQTALDLLRRMLQDEEAAG